RFADAKGELRYVPDCIAIMDELARQEMITDGLKDARLVVTGQPAFDELAALPRSTTAPQRRAIRQMLGVADDERMVLFASEPIAKILGTEPSQPPYPGCTAHTVLPAL